METNASLKPTLSPGFKRLLLLLAALNGLVGIKRIIESFLAPDIYRKDFVSGYLMAKAMLNGVNPYLPLPELADRWISGSNYVVFWHPTPHPPLVGLLSLPFGLLSYEKAAIAWLFFELACLLASLLLLLRWWGGTINASRVALLFVFALGWGPVMEELWVGQLGSCLLLLLIIAWLSLRGGKETLGGTMLGCMIALKLMAWPIVVFLALRRKWNGVMAAVAVVIAANLLALSVIGADSLRDYYFKVGPNVASIYRSYDGNYSAWTWGERLFAGYGSHFFAPPLWASEPLAKLCAYAIPVAVLLFGLRLALRAQRFDTAFGLLIGVGILVSPIAWTHYLVLASIPLVITAQRLWVNGIPRGISYLAFGLWMLLSTAGTVFADCAGLFASRMTPEGIPVVPFAAGALTLIPAAALLGFLWLIWRLDSCRGLATEFTESTEGTKGFDGVSVLSVNSVAVLQNENAVNRISEQL